MAHPAASRRPGRPGRRSLAAALAGAVALCAAAPAQPTVRAEELPPIEAGSARPPAIESPRQRLPAAPQMAPGLGPAAPVMPRADARPARLDNPALQRELAQLRRAAEPASGFGSTPAAANAAWTLGLIELHGGAAARSPALAQTWFERATRLGRQPLAYAGLAWCHIEGCKGPPDDAAARQALAQLRPRHRARAQYLEWLLNSRLQPLPVRAGDPQGVSSLALPMRELLVRAASEGDAQARIELGLEAVTNGDLPAARAYFEAGAPRSRAATANLELLGMRTAAPSAPAAASPPAVRLLEQARRAHRGMGGPANYVEALRLYQAAASQGSAAASRMLAMITSRPLSDGSINIAWMAQLAQLDTDRALPQLDSRALAGMMYRDPTPLFDLLPDAWQRQLTTPAR